MSRLGGLCEPARRRCGIVPNGGRIGGLAAAGVVEQAELELRLPVALARRLLVPLRRGLLIADDALAVIVEDAQVILRGGVTRTRRRFQFRNGRAVIAVKKGLPTAGHAGTDGRGCQPQRRKHGRTKSLSNGFHFFCQRDVSQAATNCANITVIMTQKS